MKCVVQIWCIEGFGYFNFRLYLIEIIGGVDGTRTRGLRRDRLFDRYLAKFCKSSESLKNQTSQVFIGITLSTNRYGYTPFKLEVCGANLVHLSPLFSASFSFVFWESIGSSNSILKTKTILRQTNTSGGIMKPWFKHYHNADTSKDLGPLIDILGLEGYARYWLLVELLYENFDGTQDEFKIPTSRVLTKLKMKSKRGLTKFKTGLNHFHSGFEIEITDFYVVFKTSICAELLHPEFKRSRQRQDTDKANNKEIRKKINIKNSKDRSAQKPVQTGPIDQLIFQDDISKLLKDISQTTQKRWLDLYDIDWVKRELVKALDYLEHNPKKKKRTARGLSQFLSGWMSRGWEWHLKRIPTHSGANSAAFSSSRPISEILKEQSNG